MVANMPIEWEELLVLSYRRPENTDDLCKELEKQMVSTNVSRNERSSYL